jgi:cell division protein FtsW (lipid II flippase)
MKRILPFLLVAALLMVTLSVLAQSSRHYGQSWHVMAGAGAPTSSESFAVNGTLTQLAIGASDSNNYRAESGYWYGLAPPIPFVPIGGLIIPVDKLGLLLPWMGVALLVAVVAGGAVLIWRRRGSGSPE